MTSEWHLVGDSFSRPKLYDYDALNEAVARAKTCRWLTVHEIITILTAGPNIIMPLTFEPPKDPPRSGSLFLYDRSITKDYKQDGHSWIRKQKNNKVREDHVKLRYDGNFRVSGAYVHDANNTTLHRRSYHLIENGVNVRKLQDEGKQSLVLVHYLDTVEATKKLALFAQHEKSSAQQDVMKDDNISTTVSHIILAQPKLISLVYEGQLNQSERVAKPQDDRSCQSQHGASLGLISSQPYQLPLASDHTIFRGNGISKETRINKLNTTTLSDERANFFKTETSDKLVARGNYPTNSFVNTMGIQQDFQSTIQHPLPSIDKLRGDNYEQIIPSFPSNINLCLGRSSNTLPEIIDITPSEADICSSSSVVISVSNPGGLLLYQDKRQWHIYAAFAMISDATRQHIKSITVWLAPAYVLTPFSVKCEKVPDAINFVCKLKIILVRIPAEAIRKGISKEVFATEAEHAVKDFLQHVEEKNEANVAILGPVYRSSIGTVDIITQMSKKEFHFFENSFLPNVKNQSPECSEDDDFGESTAPLSPGDRIIESARVDGQDMNINQSFQDDVKRNLMNQTKQVLAISDTTKYKMIFDRFAGVVMGGRKRKVIRQEIEGQIAKSKRAAAASSSFALSTTVHPFGSDEDEKYS